MRHARKGLNHRTPHKSHLFSIPLFLLSPPFPLSPFASFLLGLAFSLPRSFFQLTRSALPCRSGSSGHRCNVSCQARNAHVRETCFETRDTPTRSTQPRYVGDSLSLSSPAFRNIGGAARAAKRVARRRPWRLSRESLPYVHARARA